MESLRSLFTESFSVIHRKIEQEFHHLHGKFRSLPRDEKYVVMAGSSVFTSLAAYFIFRGIKRYPTVDYLTKPMYEKRQLLEGICTSVGDGDNFRLYHVPWLRFFPSSNKDWREKTIHVRLAGIDAPEAAHFGNPGQPFAEEAKKWLTAYLLNQKIAIRLHHRDQYSRAVCSVWVKKSFFWKNVSLELVKSGYATLYEQKGAVYGTIKDILMRAEKRARRKRLGMWQQNMKHYVSPADHKKKCATLALK